MSAEHLRADVRGRRANITRRVASRPVGGSRTEHPILVICCVSAGSAPLGSARRATISARRPRRSLQLQGKTHARRVELPPAVAGCAVASGCRVGVCTNARAKEKASRVPRVSLIITDNRRVSQTINAITHPPRRAAGLRNGLVITLGAALMDAANSCAERSPRPVPPPCSVSL